MAPFTVRDCALVTIATGTWAQNLREFRDGLQRVPVDSIYHHFWGRLLQPWFDEPEYNNDFAAWAWHGLHDKALAERLAVVNPVDFQDLEELREELLDIVEDRLDQSEYVPWSRADQRFHFLRSRIVVFDAGVRVETPEELGRILPSLSEGAIYYHFIDARRRTEQCSDDFCTWLEPLGERYRGLRERIGAIDPYFSSLQEIRRQLAQMFREELEEVRA